MPCQECYLGPSISVTPDMDHRRQTLDPAKAWNDNPRLKRGGIELIQSTYSQAMATVIGHYGGCSANEAYL
jgi:hypothetical protein